MKPVAALALAVALFLPSSLAAEPIEIEYSTITLTQQLRMEDIHVEFLPFSSEFGKVHYIPTSTEHGPNLAVWDVPDFNDSLGLVAGLQLAWNATIDFTITSNDPVPPPAMFLVDNLNGLRGLTGTSMIYTPDTPSIHWEIGIHLDSRAFFDESYAATYDITIGGPATATYYYIPAATIPEPATLLLLGSGLIGAEWKRRRSHG